MFDQTKWSIIDLSCSFFLDIVYSVEVPNYTWHLVLCLLDVLDLELDLCVFALISCLPVGMWRCQVRLLQSQVAGNEPGLNEANNLGNVFTISTKRFPKHSTFGAILRERERERIGRETRSSVG